MNRIRINTLLLLLCIFLPGVAQDVSDGWNKNKTTRLTKPVFVYNNWSAYDELSDNIPLNETLAMKELDHIARLKKMGVQVDYYLMDAFWFDVNEGYRKWRSDCWPEGPKRWLDACKREGIKPGLWFSTNLLRIGGEANTMKVIPEWESSVAEDGITLCLFRGGYLHHLMQTLQMYADMGIKMFKFDFAYFDAATPDAKCTMLPADIEEQNKNAFISAIKEFRYKNPDVLFIGYNGFGGDMENTVTPFRKTVDLRWLEIFDTMYCGDPRLSDVPMMNFWRSQDLYSDYMTFQYLFNGVPVQRIDNCAFMIGTTGTCYNRALNAWKGMMILTMARGGWLNVCHGNIDLLSDADIRYTLDGSEPTVESDIYEGPVYLTENTCVKAVVTDKDNQILEAPAVKNFLVNKATGCTYTLSTDAWSLDWYPVKPTLFTDGVQGFTPSNYEWAAIASGVEIVIDLKKNTTVSGVRFGTMVAPINSTLPAKSMICYLSKDGKEFRQIGESTFSYPVYKGEKEIYHNYVKTEKKDGRYLKLVINGQTELPEDYPYPNALPSIALDEIEVF